MVRNEEKYQAALRLRERGLTLSEVAKYCDVSKSTVSKWLKNNAMSVVVTKQNKRRAGQANAKRLQLVSKARQAERTARYQEVVRGAKTEFTHYQSDPLFVAGVMLYVAHGDRTDLSRIRLSSTNAAEHRIFLKFAYDYLGVTAPQARCWLLLYSAHNEATCMRHWKKHTRLPYTQFHKSQFVDTKSKQAPLHYGVGNTIIGSTVLARKLTHWCELLQKNLAK